MTLQEKVELHRLFWRGQAPRPLLGFFFAEREKPRRSGGRFPNIDIDTPVEGILEKYATPRRWHEPGDRVPSVALNYGTSFLPALAGAGYEHDGYTSWCIPIDAGAADVSIPELDRDLPLWRSYEQKLRALVDAGIEGAILSVGAMTGPMEILLGLFGGERLTLDMFDEPEAVRERARECVRLWKQVFEAEWDILGRPEGQVGFGVYVPGRSCLWSEDGMALAGGEQFEQFFREPVRQIAVHLDTSFLHTHSAGIRCYAGLAQVEELDGVEISNDPNGPPLQELIDAGVRFQQAGKCVMFSNWLRPLSQEQVDAILDAADPGRTLITLTVRDEAEADHYMRMVQDRFGSG